MKKFLLFILFLLVLAAAGLGYIYMNLGGFAKTAIEEGGSQVTGVSVTVSGVDLDLREGRATLRGLRVGNPDGFSDRDALFVEEISVTLDLTRISSDLVVIKEIFVDKPIITYEKSGGTTNLDVIKEAAEGPSSGAGSSGGSSEGGPKFIVSLVRFTNGEIHALGLSPVNDELSAVLPGFEIKDIGKSEGGVGADVVGGKIAVAITGRVIEAVLADALSDVVADPVEGLTDKIQGIFGKD